MKPRNPNSDGSRMDRAQLALHQRAPETQTFDTILREVPLGLERDVRGESVQLLNQILVDTITLRDLYKTIIKNVRTAARRTSERGGDGTNDLLVSEVLRTNETQAWFLYEHVVKMDLVTAK